MREGEVTMTELWFNLHEQLVAAREQRPIDEGLKKRVRAESPPPGSRHPVSLHSLMVILQAQRSPYLPSSLEIVRITPGGR